MTPDVVAALIPWCVVAAWAIGPVVLVFRMTRGG